MIIRPPNLQDAQDLTRGQIHQAYREGQEDQLGCLGLVLNAVTLWMTRYLDAAVTQLRAQGIQVRDEDAARLSPDL
jgi:TnpA family transposase